MRCHTSEFRRVVLQSGIHKVLECILLDTSRMSFWIRLLRRVKLKGYPPALWTSEINNTDDYQIRNANSKQFQMTKNQNVSNEAGLNFENWDLILFVCFGLRASDFGF